MPPSTPACFRWTICWLEIIAQLPNVQVDVFHKHNSSRWHAVPAAHLDFRNEHPNLMKGRNASMGDCVSPGGPASAFYPPMDHAPSAGASGSRATGNMSYATPVKFVSSGVYDPAAEATSVEPALSRQYPKPSIQPSQTHHSPTSMPQLSHSRSTSQPSFQHMPLGFDRGAVSSDSILQPASIGLPSVGTSRQPHFSASTAQHLS